MWGGRRAGCGGFGYTTFSFPQQVVVMGRLRWHGDNGSSKKGSSQESCVTDAQDQQKPATIQINSNEMGFRLKRGAAQALWTSPFIITVLHSVTTRWFCLDKSNGFTHEILLMLLLWNHHGNKRRYLLVWKRLKKSGSTQLYKQATPTSCSPARSLCRLF